MLPSEAVDEIMERLSANLKISADEIAEILEKHGVSGDVGALQSSYRKRLGQRLMASIRDETGKREVFASKSGEYVIVECCNDPQQLRAIQRRIQSNMTGLDASSKKVRGRIRFLNRFSSFERGRS
ncbi:synapsin-1 (Synapsin I) [Clostridium fessum]|uniref:synapsin-1 (Synapsin I) n=1 Tax=Clostridium fessum TaxID=2126740 RepID=UPI00399B018B